MKRIKVGVIGLAVFTALCGSAHAGDAKIGEMTGEAFIVGKDGIYRAKTGMAANAGDVVMTRQGGQLDLIVNGQAGCLMLADSVVAIANTDQERTKLMVAEGNVVLNIKPLTPGSEFTVDTPSAVATVRGTQFWGRVTGGEGEAVSTFAVKEGSVRVTAKESGKTVDLSAGQAVDLAEQAADVNARSATAGEMDAMKAADLIAKRM